MKLYFLKTLHPDLILIGLNVKKVNFQKHLELISFKNNLNMLIERTFKAYKHTPQTLLSLTSIFYFFFFLMIDKFTMSLTR